jgi:DNA-binding MarR family transcriptional regulator
MKYGDCLVTRTLLAVARQRLGLDAPRCAAVFGLLDTSAVLLAALRRPLAESGLSELKFGVLVVLFTLDPDPSTPADLAGHTGVSRSAITDALDQLAAQKFIVRERDDRDRRTIYIRLTAAGHRTLARALPRYLRTAGAIARRLDLPAQTGLLRDLALLKEDAALCPA